MPNNLYTDYTPDYSSLNETPRTEPVDTEGAGRRAEGRRVRSRRKAKPEPAPEATKSKPKKDAWFPRIKQALTSSTARVLFGLFLGFIGIYLLVSFISYFVTCVKDQSLVNSMPVGYVLHQASNAGGEGGARISEFLINECFGLGALVIVVWFIAISLKMLVGHPRFKTVNFTIKCLIILITVSLIIGLWTIGAHSQVNWGGYHGRYVNEFIIGFAGWTGAVLLSVFMVAVFVLICLRDVLVWGRKIYQERKEARRIAAEEEAEREARAAEIRRMRQQEEIDDLRAGEATRIDPESVAGVHEDDTQVDFSSGDLPLYSVPEEPEYDLEPEEKPVEDTRKIGEESSASVNYDNEYDTVSESHVMEEKDPDVPDVPEVPDVESAVSAEVQTEPQGEGTEPEQADDKMVVTVNHIGEADKRQLRSEVDTWESTNYKFPPMDLLNQAVTKVSVDEEEQQENKERIKSTLLSFGIPITDIQATIGPTVTLYEIRPDAGVKISKIRGLVDDIALSLAAKGVRIIAPIPGKGTVGIEVANKDPQTVSMRTVIGSRKYQEKKVKLHLPVALGSTISSGIYIADLAEMPHLLVAGATGQGKSVGLNAIIASLLYSLAPWQLKFVMIDPKQVEFSLYNKIKNHYMAVIPEDVESDEPVITDTTTGKVEAVLNSLVIEMEMRYSLLKDAHVRNIEEYNDKIRACQLNPENGHKFLPYIVVIVDEFGDLIMASGKSVEMPIARLAQKARAVGMHVIIATQRPSTNVITGIIKANFPARISFKVSSGVDSKTILDTPGAQQLIGRGDMLIFHKSEMVRVQCAFIDTPEVEGICEYVGKQPYAQGPYVLPEPQLASSDDGPSDEVNMRERDPLFDEVARMIVNKGQASTSSIQRLFSLGYTRAGRIMDQMEQAHIVGPNQGGKPRAVLVDPMELENILSSL